ncbi:hypothetical protein V501_01531, partial [Pseudogymnoascus sp. VKM F-4519 (FW-2642)]
NNIDLLILPPHCSHLLQPLDVGVFGPLKKYHAYETDRLHRAGINRFQRSEWVTLYQTIRPKALSVENIRSGWRGAGLVPFSERRVLSQLPLPLQLQPTTPQQQVDVSNLDLSILKSSPPEGTELRAANAVFNSALASREPPTTPTRRYATRVTQLLERQNAELTVIRKELQEQRAILQRRNTHKTGKRRHIPCSGHGAASGAANSKEAIYAKEYKGPKRMSPNQERAKWRTECREKLANHIHSQLGLAILPIDVKLIQNPRTCINGVFQSVDEVETHWHRAGHGKAEGAMIEAVRKQSWRGWGGRDGKDKDFWVVKGLGRDSKDGQIGVEVKEDCKVGNDCGDEDGVEGEQQGKEEEEVEPLEPMFSAAILFDLRKPSSDISYIAVDSVWLVVMLEMRDIIIPDELFVGSRDRIKMPFGR